MYGFLYVKLNQEYGIVLRELQLSKAFFLYGKVTKLINVQIHFETKQQSAKKLYTYNKIFCSFINYWVLSRMHQLINFFPFNYNRKRLQFDFGKPKNEIRLIQLINCMNQIDQLKFVKNLVFNLFGHFFIELYILAATMLVRELFGMMQLKEIHLKLQILFAYFFLSASQTIVNPFETEVEDCVVQHELQSN